MQSPTLFGSTISAGSIASPREQRVHRKLDGRYSRTSPTDDEADDSIPDDVAFRTFFVVHEGKS
jgi:hypothetical protein